MKKTKREMYNQPVNSRYSDAPVTAGPYLAELNQKAVNMEKLIKCVGGK
jgi:hypothetical protein